MPENSFASNLAPVLKSFSRPILHVVVDTEEEFDWHAPFDREARSVRALASIARVQSIMDRFAIASTYVVDYPVAEQAHGYGALKPLAQAGTIEIGAHLHPWVNPPYDEEVNARNSFPGNLPEKLESAKLTELTEKIEESFGMRPKSYKAGRYGIGPNTPGILIALGYEVDLSPRPPFDFSAEEGPDFSNIPMVPFWLGDTPGQLVCIPATGALVGCMGRAAAPIYRMATRPLFEKLKVPGILSRLGLVDRLSLSPEGYSLDEMIKLTKFALRRGVRIFSLTFHSPSAAPGHTPYVQTEAQATAFCEALERYFDFFINEISGVSMFPSEIRKQILAPS
ncbi:MAG: polysaccharide deacetylase family protein [Pseudomonadota bacterium]